MKKHILVVILMSHLLAPSFCQIPIKKITENIVEFDKEYDSLMNNDNYSINVERFYVVADMNNDGRQDIILHAYARYSDVSVNVFYNQSTDSVIKFKNNKLSGFILRGNGSPMVVGDVNHDNKLDILAPTANYHGDEALKLIDYYPNKAWNSPDRLFVQQGSSFKEYVQPDTLNNYNGNLIDTDGDGNDEFIIADVGVTRKFPTKGNNLLIKYSVKGDTLAREFLLEVPVIENVRYGSYLGSINEKLKDSFYIPVKKYSLDVGSNYWYPDTVFILNFKKGEKTYSMNKNCDTIGIVPIPKIVHKGVKYFYDLTNEYGTYIYDIDKDGKEETIVEQFSMYPNFSGAWEWLPGDPIRSRLKIYNNKGEDLTNKFIPQEFQGDPQNCGSTQGFALQDINGDGLKDILPYNAWGWSNYGNEKRLKKYILLNTGKSFHPFTIDIGDNYSIAGRLEGNNYPIDINSESGKEIFTIQRYKNANVLELDYSQFKFPCSENLPKITLSGRLFVCGDKDSIQLKVDSKQGYNISWLKNDTVLSNTNQVLIKKYGDYSVKVTNLGGCTNQQTINVTKRLVPVKPMISVASPDFIASNYISGNTWFKDGLSLTDTTQKIKLIIPGSYTVKVIQNGCSSELSTPYAFSVTSVSDIEDGKYIKFYPNPTHNELRISHNLYFNTLHISIFDCNGKKIIEKNDISNEELIHLDGLLGGVYLLRLYSSDGKNNVVSKIVKN